MFGQGTPPKKVTTRLLINIDQANTESSELWLDTSLRAGCEGEELTRKKAHDLLDMLLDAVKIK